MNLLFVASMILITLVRSLMHLIHRTLTIPSLGHGVAKLDGIFVVCIMINLENCIHFYYSLEINFFLNIYCNLSCTEYWIYTLSSTIRRTMYRTVFAKMNLFALFYTVQVSSV
jgi:hypothetical protein